MRATILSIVILCIASFTQIKETTPGFIENITYAKVDTIELQLNIAMPSGVNSPDEKFPLLVFIHGGGWREGHRNAYNKQIKNAAKRGFVAATISHRLTALEDKNGIPLYPWPAAIHDCKAAIRFLKSHASAYKIDTSRIGACGASSGGHLALMLGITDPTHNLEGDIQIIKNNSQASKVSGKIHALVNISGPTDMVLCHKAPVVTPYAEYLLEGSPNDNMGGYIEASPISYLKKEMPPIMTIHGELDDVVPFEQALLLDYKIKQLGGYHKLLSFENEGHIFKGEARQQAWDALYKFFDKQLK